jgi:hemoglobin
MMKDISNRQDVELLVNTFYDKIRADKAIGYIFNQAIGDDWSRHLPKMYAFWSLILIEEPGYSGNTVSKHIELDRKIKIEDAHYNRWVELWNNTLDSLFAGPKADEAKKRAKLMKDLIRFKVESARTGKSLQ